MTCKCRDTDTRRCRQQFSTPDPYKLSGYRMDGTPTRQQAKRETERIIAEDLADAEALARITVTARTARPTCETCGWQLDAAWTCGCDEPLDFDDDEPSCGCDCRRCLLHDDHGGCLTPERHVDQLERDIMLDAGLPADASYDDLARALDVADDEAHALAWETAGWGETSFDPDDIQWGFGIDRTLQRCTTTGTGRRRPPVGVAIAIPR